MSKIKDLCGRVYGSLFVISFAGLTSARKARWFCVCACGRGAAPIGASLANGHTTSCGCVRATIKKTHGATGTPTHNTWLAMKARCANPKASDYPNYGGRGVTVCNRWLNFENFLRDMGARPVGMTLERMNVNGGYEPGNCEWATQKQQSRNRRSTVYLTADGVCLPLVQWAEKLNIPRATLQARLRYGWSAQRVCTTPVLVVRKRKKGVL